MLIKFFNEYYVLKQNFLHSTNYVRNV